MIKKVYVPLDGSDVADVAIRPAAQLALRAGVDLVLVAARWPNARESTMRSYLDAHVAFLDGPVQSWVTLDLAPADAITEVAAEPGALVCMATHGRGAIGAAVLGSVAQEVVRTATGSLVLIGPKLDKGWTLRDEPSILVGIDGSPQSRSAAHAAAGVASAIGASLDLALVYDPIYDDRHNVPVTIGRSVAELRRLGDELREQGVGVDTTPIDGFDPSQVLLGRLSEHGHSMLAVGSHGRRRLARLALGSVSSTLVRRAPVPVLVTRPDWSELA